MSAKSLIADEAEKSYCKWMHYDFLFAEKISEKEMEQSLGSVCYAIEANGAKTASTIRKCRWPLKSKLSIFPGVKTISVHHVSN